MARPYKKTAGIDPGKTGAIGIDAGPASSVHDIPLIAVHSKSIVNAQALRKLLADEGVELIVIEHQGVRPKQGISSSGQTMFLYGGLLATCMTLGVPVEVVNAAAWKRRVGLLGADKEVSRRKAIQAFPKLSEKLKRKKDHNRAEALLLARFGQTLH